MSAAFALLARELRLAWRQGSDAAIAVLFFVLAASLVPFAVGPEPELLGRIAGGMVWIAALLAVVISLERLFAGDAEDGTLEALAGGRLPLWALGAVKVAAHWLLTGLPVTLSAPLVALALNLPGAAVPVLLAGLVLGTPILSLIGGIGAALALGAQRGGVLLALLVLPLMIPVLIFAVAGLLAVLDGRPASPHLMLLGALLALSLPLAPLAIGAALKQALR